MAGAGAVALDGPQGTPRAWPRWGLATCRSGSISIDFFSRIKYFVCSLNLQLPRKTLCELADKENYYCIYFLVNTFISLSKELLRFLCHYQIKIVDKWKYIHLSDWPFYWSLAPVVNQFFVFIIQKKVLIVVKFKLQGVPKLDFNFVLLVSKQIEKLGKTNLRILSH